MRTAKELRFQLAKLKSDERHKYKLALVQINAPLALIQVEIQAKIDALEWALNDKRYNSNRDKENKP